MTPLDIKIELLRRGTNQARVGKGIGVSRELVSRTVNRKGKVLRVRKAISEAIGKPLLEVFPDEQFITRSPNGRIVKRSGFRASTLNKGD